MSFATLRLIFKLAPWVAILFLLAWAGRLNDLRYRWHHQYTSEHAGRLQDRATYEQAQRDAAGKNEAQIAHVKQQQQEISNETVSTLSARLELIRSELRKASAPQRPADGSQAGPASQSPCTVTDPAWMCLSPADRLHAAENEERHDELIDWNLKQSAIDPNK
jgi:hypothetical protein